MGYLYTLLCLGNGGVVGKGGRVGKGEGVAFAPLCNFLSKDLEQLLAWSQSF